MIAGFDLQKARQAVERARQALSSAEHRFDMECGPDNTRQLIDEIKVAERRLADARAELARLQAASPTDHMQHHTRH